MKKKLGDFLLTCGDWAYDIGLEWLAEVCYENGRKLGSKLEWPHEAGKAADKK